MAEEVEAVQSLVNDRLVEVGISELPEYCQCEHSIVPVRAHFHDHWQHAEVSTLIACLCPCILT